MSAGGTNRNTRYSRLCLCWRSKISEDMRPTSIVQIAVPVRQAPSFWEVLFIPFKYPVSSICLASACVSNQPKSLELALNCSTTPVFWCVSLYGVLTNAAQLCSVRGIKAWTTLAKNPSSHVFFYVLALSEHTLSCVCFSKMFLNESVLAFHTCVHFNEMKHSFKCLPHQNTMELTFQSTFKFLLHCNLPIVMHRRLS